MLVFQSTLPSSGQGALRNRDNPRVLGTDKEQTLLNPIDTYVELFRMCPRNGKLIMLLKFFLTCAVSTARTRSTFADSK